jgi:hypothetical protein
MSTTPKQERIRMMRKLEQLKQEARQSATWRGHKLTRFISGEAVALTCDDPTS